ncbi:MAG: quinone-interacting membrane-bound oxidoreductase complex subunit QmoC [bacterium]|nr:quinone-interacting membrane-bound oxidoreductase complex subunit QmoC [bacterium]
MADTVMVKPDLNFIRELKTAGGDTMKQCYQCATCSVVCPQSPDDRPFPRKEMIWAGWGLKDKLVADPDVWLCHHCGDCTSYCPRGAKPGEVLGAIRKQAIEHFAAVPALGRAVNSKGGMLQILAIPVVILAIAAFITPGLNRALPESLMHVGAFGNFINTWLVDGIFISAALFALWSAYKGITNLWEGMKASTSLQPSGNLMENIIAVVKEIFPHGKFKECDVNKERSTAHLLTFYAFIGLAITTTIGFIIMYFTGETSGLGKTLFMLMKVIGNVSAAALLAGAVLLILLRKSKDAKTGQGTYFDWGFLGMVLLVGVTGLLSQFLRYMGADNHQPGLLAKLVYFVHLVIVFYLFAYAPYSKFAHIFYRTTALVFARMTAK